MENINNCEERKLWERKNIEQHMEDEKGLWVDPIIFNVKTNRRGHHHTISSLCGKL
jgi:hypothetical protein